jgi:hypothetical protein
MSCRQKEESGQSSQAPPVQSNAGSMQSSTVRTAVVNEVLQATNYTYLNVNQGDESYWMAISKRTIEPGSTISYTSALEMNNFTSKDLSRTFESIYFVDQISVHSDSSMMTQSEDSPHRMKPVLEKMDIEVEPIEGGITLAQLYENSQNYADQVITVRGVVTKANRAILDRNWFHVQDGTGDAESFDLTITTQDDAQVGDVVTFKGKITLNKDFGAGYQYDVIMEEAALLTE